MKAVMMDKQMKKYRAVLIVLHNEYRTCKVSFRFSGEVTEWLKVTVC